MSFGRQFALHNYACSIGVDSISSSSQGCQGLLQSVPSLQVSVATPYAILQYCYGFNRLQLWLLAQCLLQSVLSLQVSVAIPILKYCYGFNRRRLSLLAQGLLQSVPSLQVSATMSYYSIVMVSIGYANINVKIPVFQKC